jgi:DNA-directed RNA polymerase specialized sigma24 family protein
MSQQAQEMFLAIMQCVSTHARIAFRHIRNEHDREDFVQETLCVVWKWTLRMLEQHKDPREFPTAVATLAARHVRSGRKFAGGKLGKHDVHSRFAQARNGFTLQALPASTAAAHDQLYGAVCGQRQHDAMEEMLGEHDRSPVPEQVAFRLDFALWRLSYDLRRRDIIDEMMAGESTTELSEKFKVSPGRISQMRREFEATWQSYCDK